MLLSRPLRCFCSAERRFWQNAAAIVIGIQSSTSRASSGARAGSAMKPCEASRRNGARSRQALGWRRGGVSRRGLAMQPGSNAGSACRPARRRARRARGARRRRRHSRCRC